MTNNRLFEVVPPNSAGEESVPESVTALPSQADGHEYIIDPEFESLLPKKTQAQYEALKESIRRDGEIRDALVVWLETRILLDGHNRERIGKEFDFKLPICWKSFASREEAMMWIVKNQLTDRRNLNTFQRVELALKSKPIFTAQAKANQRAAGGAVPLRSAEPIEAVKEVAKLAGTSPDTVKKVEKILAKSAVAAVAAAIDALRRGEPGISINGVFQDYCVPKEVHQFGKLFPEVTGQELNDLAVSIRLYGLFEPITLFEDKILDGKNRYMACAMAGVAPRYTVYEGDDPEAFVRSKNFYRHHVNPEQRADVLAKWQDGSTLKQAVASQADMPKVDVPGVPQEDVLEADVPWADVLTKDEAQEDVPWADVQTAPAPEDDDDDF